MAESIVQNSHFLLDSDIDISDYCDYFEYTGHHTFSTTIGFYCPEVLFLDLATLLKIPYNEYRGGTYLMLGYTLENMHVTYTETQSGKMPYYWLIQFWAERDGRMSNCSSTGTGSNYVSRIGIDNGQTIQDHVRELTSFGQSGVINPPNAAHCQLYVDFETSNWNDPNPQYYRVDAEFDFTAVALIS